MKFIPRVVIGGAHSGVGKTTFTTGLIRALQKRGLRVASFKCGPDYLDPTYLTKASGHPCHNIDGWMMGEEGVKRTFARASAGYDIAVIEGVMGVFDGASPTSEAGSTAEIAKWLEAPVIILFDAGGMARTSKALAFGLKHFDPLLNVAGFIANKLGSQNHLEIIKSALGTELPLLGGLPKSKDRTFPERYLGLTSATNLQSSDELFDYWADLLAAWCDIDGIIARANEAGSLELGDLNTPAMDAGHGTVKIGIARDSAFDFYYDENLALLQHAGAELVYFSPMKDIKLPDVDGLYFGGGYPEIHANELAKNIGLKAEISQFAQSGRPIYAECGGLIYLTKGVTLLSGEFKEFCGLIDANITMYDKLRGLGYVEVETMSDTFLGPKGTRFRGHEFRYSDISSTGDCYKVRKRRGASTAFEGFGKDTVIASYVHAHWASNPQIPRNFVDACRRSRA